MDYVLYLALARKRAELKPAQSIGLSLEQRASLPPSFSLLWSSRVKVAEETQGEALRATDPRNWDPGSGLMLAYPSHAYDEG